MNTINCMNRNKRYRRQREKGRMEEKIVAGYALRVTGYRLREKDITKEWRKEKGFRQLYSTGWRICF